MRRGYIKLWRKSLDSSIFANEGLWKLWCLCLMKANHEAAAVSIPGLLKPVKIEPGQFITGRDSLHYDYHQGSINEQRYARKLKPTAITLYRWLLNLQNMQMLHIKTFNKFSIVTVTNWPLYQENEQQMNNRRTTDEHKQELSKKKDPEETSALLCSLRGRYGDSDLIDRAFDAIRSTRKTGKVADSILVAQLQNWARYPVEHVEAGIRTYLDKDYAGQGRGEPYLLGVIKGKANEAKQKAEKATWRERLRDL